MNLLVGYYILFIFRDYWYLFGDSYYLNAFIVFKEDYYNLNNFEFIVRSVDNIVIVYFVRFIDEFIYFYLLCL